MVDILEGCRAIVTGGSRGLGRGIALELARAGADVGLVYRKRADEAKEVAAEIEALGRHAPIAQADVAVWEDVETAVNSLVRELGGLEIVIGNAGIASPNLAIADLPVDRWRKILSVDLDGAFHTAKATINHLVDSGGHGSMVFVSTVGSLRGTATQGAYSASKAAVNSLTRTLALELAPHGVRVNAVAPGIFETDMTRFVLESQGEDGLRATVPLGRAAQPAELGRTVAWLCADASSYVTGEIIRVDGGLGA
ncbi:MAG: SDR family NAD(P)-dependent oxidoreductase [Acidimicrobiales bacterium]|nr:SDR family NAD(P)-dependent oxidoreductase [Acidimicrobiales bacterium]